MILIFLSSSLINFENLVLQFISRTQERFRNKSNEFFKNKLSIINEKYYHQNNIILFKIFQNYSILIILYGKEFILQQLIILYIFLMISFVEKEKYLSGINFLL